MAGLKTIVDDLASVAEAVRAFYELKDGKYHLSLDGTPHGFAPAADLALANGRVVEFRDNNIALTKEVEALRPIKAAFDGVDPKAAKDAIAKVAELGSKGVKNTDDVAKLVADGVAAAMKPVQDELATERTLRAQSAERADKATLRSVVGEAFTKAGGKAKALDFILGQAEGAFEVKDGKVVAKSNKFSAQNPGNPLDVVEWLGGQVKDNDFAFEPSNGGGANPRTGGGGGRAGQVVLTNPTAQQLGDPKNSEGIATGAIRVEYTTQ